MKEFRGLDSKEGIGSFNLRLLFGPLSCVQICVDLALRAEFEAVVAIIFYDTEPRLLRVSI